ncbi:MAG: lysylphosphatidylglycerol synthase transmembrane domain-containing protein [Vicinamibacterales bacterium]
MTESRISPDSLSVSRSPRWVAVGIVIGLLALVLIIVASDADALYRAVGNVRPDRLVWPALCTAGSYAAMAMSYQRIAAAAGLELKFGEMMRLTLASTAINYIFSTGGLSGLAARSYYFSQQRGLSTGTVSISLAQTFLTNFVIFAFLFWGLLNLLVYDPMSGPSQAIVGFLFLISLCLCLAAAVVGSRGARLRLSAFLMRLPHFFSRVFHTREQSIRERLVFFEEELHEGIDFLISRGTRMVGPFLYIALDWFLMLATLYTAFHCVGHPVPMHIVIIGFSTGVFLSLVNLVPGGLGIMEGSMAAVFAALDVPLEPAVVATLIFRVSYYILPLLLTLLFCRQLFAAGRRQLATTTPGTEPSTR